MTDDQDFDIVIRNVVVYVSEDMAALELYGNGRLANVQVRNQETTVKLEHCLFWGVPTTAWWRLLSACSCFWLCLTTGIPHKLPDGGRDD